MYENAIIDIGKCDSASDVSEAGFESKDEDCCVVT